MLETQPPSFRYFPVKLGSLDPIFEPPGGPLRNPKANVKNLNKTFLLQLKSLNLETLK